MESSLHTSLRLGPFSVLASKHQKGQHHLKDLKAYLLLSEERYKHFPVLSHSLHEAWGRKS